MSLEIYKNKIRIRVCSMIIENNKILLLKHIGLNDDNIFWAPPGGGLEFQESIENCLIRETMEETGIKVLTHTFIDVNEYLSNQLHAVELFYKIDTFTGSFKLGYDPETSSQILSSGKYFTKEELKALPKNHKHPILSNEKVLQLL